MSDEMNRRTALTALAGLLAALWSGAIAILAGAFLSTPLRRKSEGRQALLGSVRLSGEEFRRVNMEFPLKDGWHERSEFMTVFVRASDDGSPEVISSRCPHLGCTVNWDSDSAEFRCPCHAGRFASDGSVISGPPPGPLTRLPAEVRDGNIYISLDA